MGKYEFFPEFLKAFAVLTYLYINASFLFIPSYTVSANIVGVHKTQANWKFTRQDLQSVESQDEICGKSK